MGESYTIGGDTLQITQTDYILGQSFTPRETFTVFFVDMNIRESWYEQNLIIEIWHANILGEPIGIPITWATKKYHGEEDATAHRRRFHLSHHISLYKDFPYIMTLRVILSTLRQPLAWQYDAGDASYPRGERILSMDDGVSWLHFPNDDHIFTAWGAPPAPPPPPDPPIQNFAPVSIKQTYTGDGIDITIATNVPCHLTLYWTNEPVRKHPRTTIMRGLTVPLDVQYCFVSYTPVEQNEPGDTDEHTFSLDPWPYGEKRWITVKGTVDGEDSPSVGPIMGKTHWYTETFYPVLDGWTMHHTNGVGLHWPDLVSAAGTIAGSAAPNGPGLSILSNLAGRRWSHLTRTLLLFDTSTLPSHMHLKEASLFIHGLDKNDPLSIKPNLALVISYTDSTDVLVPSDYQKLRTQLLADPISWDDLHIATDDDPWNEFVLYPSILAGFIMRHGITKLALRNQNYDIATELEPGEHNPQWKPYVNRTRFRIYFNEAPLDKRPYLRIRYDI